MAQTDDTDAVQSGRLASLGGRPSNSLEFSAPLLRIQDTPPSPLAGWFLRLLMFFFACIASWAVFGRLDIVAVADGKLVPEGYLKIVQPAEQGVVKDILVKEGQRVKAGEVLIRMDSVLSNADAGTLRHDFHHRRMALHRIDAELAGEGLVAQQGVPASIHAAVQAQYAANVHAYQNALAQEQALREKANHDLAAARETKAKLEQTLPHYVAQEAAYAKLSKDGFAGNLMATDKQRERIEREQDLRTQEYVIRSNLALLAQSERKIAQITADYRRQLRTERVEVATQFGKTSQELAKIEHRQGLLELRAPQDGTVKDLATHTAGTVAAPGTILMTLVPRHDSVFAEVWLGNQDVGFVRPGQDVKIKLATFPFQKYGMVHGKVVQVGADASESPSPGSRPDMSGGRDRPATLAFRTLVKLDSQNLAVDAGSHPVAAGMQVSAEINLGTRSILEYLLSPVQKAFHEAGRER